MERPLTVSDLLDNASRLDSRDFESFYKALLTLRARRIAPVLSQKETDLLEKIYQKLPSETSERYDLLTNKRRDDNIPPAEYEELLALVSTVEQYNVQRLKFIVELASLRKMTAQELMEKLGLMPLYQSLPLTLPPAAYAPQPPPLFAPPG